MSLGLLLLLGALESTPPDPDAGVSDASYAGASLASPIDAGVVAPEPLPSAAPPIPAAVVEPAHLAVWLQPLGLAGYGAGSALLRTSGAGLPVLVYFPVGASIVVPHLELNVELTFTLQLATQQFGGGNGSTRVGLMAAAGPLVHLGELPFNGFFVEPKIAGGYFTNLGDQNLFQNLDHWVVALGADVGYQLTFRHLYLALAVGLAIGAGNYGEWEVVTPWQVGFTQITPQASPVILFNVNLLRLGGWR